MAVLYSPPQIPVDSTGLQWILRDSCGLSPLESSGVHQSPQLPKKEIPITGKMAGGGMGRVDHGYSRDGGGEREFEKPFTNENVLFRARCRW